MSLQNRITQVAEALNKHITNDILAYTIAEAASCYWDEATADDFCLQSFDGQSAIFGSSNRLVWTPAAGFRPDCSYCTQRFLEQCDFLGRLPTAALVIKHDRVD